MRIPAHLNGPPGAAHGGYLAGVLSGELAAGPAEVWFRAPTPLETDLRLQVADGRAEVWDGETLCAEAAAVDAPPARLPFVALASAEAAMADYPGAAGGRYGTCFGCGAYRADGLGVYPGPVGRGLAATVWRPRGRVAEEWVWSALDCASGWAWPLHEEPLVTGRLQVGLLVDASELDPAGPYVLVSAQVGEQGRRRFSEAVLYSAGGQAVAAASATWVAVG